MLKKSLIMASLLMFASASMCFADTKAPCNCGNPKCNCAKQAPCNCKKPPKGPDFAKRNAEFEKRLKLTDEQKAKAIGALKRGMHELRMQNMKEFESILTSKQLKELKKMKEEGRKKFEKEHKKGGHPAFGPNGPRPEGPCPPPPPED